VRIAVDIFNAVWQVPRFRNLACIGENFAPQLELSKLLFSTWRKHGNSDDQRLAMLFQAMDTFASTPVFSLVVDGAPGLAAIVNTADVNGTTPLHKAASMLNPGLVQLFLDLGAAREALDVAGDSGEQRFRGHGSSDAAASLLPATVLLPERAGRSTP